MKNRYIKKTENGYKIELDDLGKTEISTEEYKQFLFDLSDWEKFLNWGFGATAFVFAQACVGTPHPPLHASIGLLWLLIMYAWGLKSWFPSLITKLRKDNAFVNRKMEEVLIRSHFGLSSILTKMPFFFLGCAYLLFIILLWFHGFQMIDLNGATIGDYFLTDDCICSIKHNKSINSQP